MPELSYTLSVDDQPAQAEVLDAVQRIEVEEALDRASVFRIRLGMGSTSEGDWSVLSEDLFRPLVPVAVRVAAGTGPGQPLIRGYVTSTHSAFEPDPGRSFVEVTGMDATVRMNLEDKVRAFTDLSDGDIATMILGEYDLVPEVTSTSPSRLETETTTIQRGTDARFLRRLAARNGFAFYVELNPLIGMETGVFGPLDLSGQPQGVLSVRFGQASNVERFSARYEMLRPTTAEAGGVEISGKSVQSAQISSTSETALGSDGALDALSPQPVALPSDTGLADSGELQTYCQAVVDRSAWAVEAEGTLDTGAFGKALRARKTVNVRGSGELYSGTYMVRKVLHAFSGERYTQEFELVRNALGVTGSELFVDEGALAGAG